MYHVIVSQISKISKYMNIYKISHECIYAISIWLQRVKCQVAAFNLSGLQFPDIFAVVSVFTVS